MGRQKPVHRDRPEAVPFGEPEYAKLRAADAGCIAQHGLKYRRKLAGRTGNDLQYLRGGSLLLPRLIKVFLRLGELSPA